MKERSALSFFIAETDWDGLSGMSEGFISLEELTPD
jgi:hypothetical protein